MSTTLVETESPVVFQITKKKTAGKKKAKKDVPPPLPETEIAQNIPQNIQQMLATEQITQEEKEKDGHVLQHLEPYIEEPFQIMETYFQGQYLKRLVRHQLESYNYFINTQLHKTIQMFNPLMIHSENDYIEQHDKYLLEIEINFKNFK